MNATPLPPGKIPEFSVVRGDVLDRVQRSMGLVPRDSEGGAARRAILYTLLAWLPLVIWALLTKRAFEEETGDPLLRHFGLHVRFLVALPILIHGEKVAHAAMKRLLPRFISSGLITEEKVPAYREVIAGMLRLRDSALPWVAIVGVIIAAMLVPQTGSQLRELSWAREGAGLGFGGWWYLLVSRPLLQIFLFGWVWRILLVTLMLKRIGKLGLELVPTHPDGLGGLGFLEGLPRAFLPMAVAMSCILCAQAAHDVLWHGLHVVNLRLQGVVFGVLVLGLCIAPLMVFVPLLKRAKRKGLAEYGDFIARHERLVHRRWIDGRKDEADEMLDAPELGPSADIFAIYGSVRAMRVMPFSSRSLINLALPVALPMLAVGAIEIPVAELLGKIFKTVF